jgi:hypothetical protein
MTFGDIDAMNQRALESLDRLAEIGTYDHTERLRMSEPLDDVAAPVVSRDPDLSGASGEGNELGTGAAASLEPLTPAEAFALAQVSVLDPGLHSYRVDK